MRDEGGMPGTTITDSDEEGLPDRVRVELDLTHFAKTFESAMLRLENLTLHQEEKYQQMSSILENGVQLGEEETKGGGRGTSQKEDLDEKCNSHEWTAGRASNKSAERNKGSGGTGR